MKTLTKSGLRALIKEELMKEAGGNIVDNLKNDVKANCERMTPAAVAETIASGLGAAVEAGFIKKGYVKAFFQSIAKKESYVNKYFSE